MCAETERPPLRVLLVDDNYDDIVLTRMAFKKSHVPAQLHVAADGARAFEFLRWAGRAGDRGPDLVLLDLNMPGTSGLEVLAQLRGQERYALLPVILLTSSARKEDLLRAYDLGCNAYIQKPSDFRGLVRAINALGEHWSSQARLASRTT